MKLGEYDFNRHYGWIQNRYGLSWQLILTDPQDEPRPPMMPSLLFVGGNCGKAEEAGAFYSSVFPDSAGGLIARYPAGEEFDKEGTIMFSGTIYLTNHDLQQ